MENIYTRQHMTEALKKAAQKYPELNIGSSKFTYTVYERLGIMKLPPKQPGTSWRFYSGDLIKENVARVIKYKRAKMLKLKKV